MNTLRPTLLIGCLAALSAGCGADYEWRALPTVDGAQGWLLAAGGQTAQWFGLEGTSVPRFDRGRLWALPVPTDTLATPSPPALGTGNLMPVLANFTFEDEAWQPVDPDPIRVPVVPAECGDQCVLFEPCRDCMFAAGAQTCGVCEPVAPVQPSLPSKECPAGWQGTDFPDSHYSCAPVEVVGLKSACPNEQRWSMSEARCIDIAPCTSPTIAPAENAIYVDASASAGGDGSLANPFRDVPQPAADQTIVLAPGTYSGAVRIDQPGVRLVGHGLCSVLTGTTGAGVIRIAGVQALVDHLRVESDGVGVSLYASQGAEVDLQDVLLTSEQRALDSDGVVRALRSRFIRYGVCEEDWCEPPEAAVRLAAGGVFEDIDVEGPSAVWAESAGLTLRNTRLMPSAAGDGLFGRGPGLFTIENSTSFGGRDGLFLHADGNMQVNLTDVQITTRTSTLGPRLSNGISIVGTDQFLAKVDLMRTSIESSGIGIDIEYGTVVATQLRLDAKARGIDAIENERIHSVSVSDSWLQAGEEVMTVTGSDAFVGNSWVRACPACALPDRNVRSVFFGQPRFEDITPDTLEIRVAHVVADFRYVAFQFSALVMFDLTAFSTRPDMLRSREMEGARWSIHGPTNLLEVRERLDVSDVALYAQEPGAATCIRGSAEISIDKFSIEGPVGTVALGRENPTPGAPDLVERWRLSQGSLLGVELLASSVDDCNDLQPWEFSPVLDRVRFR